MELQKFCDMVTLELKEMKRIGMRVPKEAIEMSQDLEVMEEYEDMKTSECADLLIELANIK